MIKLVCINNAQSLTGTYLDVIKLVCINNAQSLTSTYLDVIKLVCINNAQGLKVARRPGFTSCQRFHVSSHLN